MRSKFQESTTVAVSHQASMLQFPNFRIFPGNIDRMVKMLQQAFAAVEEAEAEDVVVDECRKRPEHNVGEASTLASGDRHFGAERGVAVHVLDIVGQSRVGVMS